MEVSCTAFSHGRPESYFGGGPRALKLRVRRRGNARANPAAILLDARECRPAMLWRKFCPRGIEQPGIGTQSRSISPGMGFRSRSESIDGKRDRRPRVLAAS